jgi:GNAT superfamily N-acetyltransferase
MNPVTIRPADMNDLDDLTRLYFDFHEFHVHGVPDRLISLGDRDTYDSSGLKQALEKIFKSDDSIIFLAIANDQAVGFAEVYYREDESNPLRVAWRYGDLQSLMVDEKYRKHGIGRLLVETSEKWAKDKGAAEMRLDIWEFDQGPLHFYENIGYHTLRRKMFRNLR